ncbi:hypothetical protein [Aestuariicoccus sp. MJ-SS9]|uniref:hypothetical protein n=1 Tax=Aestuariicoccus sp. MJ-SS9 TaxID=3079855 RepID=UPI0029123E1B|nr:hypothetical protein [Aestuariicoccus sp. MJ-SS9]MDU8912031.1 hypothetical protein [Aestuariicoccus sp. MJ-SS9]
MKISTIATVAGLWAGAAAAHPGAHVHPHEGASWLVVAAALGVIGLAARLAVVRARAGR